MSNSSEGGLATPVLLKLADNMGWPKDSRVFYLLTADGLFICRNHPFFRSSVLARGWPSELAHHKEFVRLAYPKVPRRLLELCVGFFGRIADDFSAEAAAVLLWDSQDHRMRLLIPDQVSKCYRTCSGSVYGLSVHYEMPVLPARLVVIGDVHSHVDGRAYASYADRYDEVYRPGLHIVVGRVDREPPEFYVDAIVDGVRFTVAPDVVLEGYHRRRPGVPAQWLRRVKIEIDDPYLKPAKVSYDRRDDRASSCGASSSCLPSTPASSVDRYYGAPPPADHRRYDDTARKPRHGGNGDGAADKTGGSRETTGRQPAPPDDGLPGKGAADDAS
jgi:proteasome lid subunit RPN8/RPN11